MITAVRPNISTPKLSFGNTYKNSEPENPINKKGERSLALKATVGAGILAGLRALVCLVDEGFTIEDFFNLSKKLSAKSLRGAEGVTTRQRAFKTLGIFTLLTGSFVAAVAAIYTIYKTPNIEYQAKVNSFVKGKDMDLYIKSNKVEMDLYKQLIDKAKAASPDEKAKVQEQYLKLAAAKNEVPDSVKI